jgi:hypothetical protein
MTKLYKTRPVQKNNFGTGSKNIFRLQALIVLMLLLIAGKGWTQTVFTDDFNRATLGTSGGTPTMTYSTGTTASSASIFTTTVTTLPNYVFQIYTGATAAAGRSYMTGPLSTYSSPFTSTLSSNTGPVTWTFNMKTNRTTALSGFDGGNYGSAVILGMTSADPTNATTNGYAVVLVKGTTRNAVKLVRFANGIVLNANVTTIIGPSPDLAAMTNYASVKVVYTPSTNTWQLYVRDDGSTTEPTDPLTGTLTQVGTSVVNSTYTSSTMTNFGFFWNHSNGSGSSNKGIYDNFTVSVNPVVTATLSVTTSNLTGFNYVVGSGPSASQTFNISGSNLDGTAVTVTGSTDYEVATDLNPTFSGSVNIPYTLPTLASTPVYVRLKAGLSVGNYNSEALVNSGGGDVTSENVSCSGYVLGGPATYTWTGATDNNWTVATNWSPARTSPAINDILQFTNGNTYTVTSVPAQTIAQLLVSGGSKITLQADAPVTLTIAGTTGDDLSVSGTGSELNISGTNVLTIALNAGTNGLISSSITVSGSAHVIKSTDVSSLVFANGSVFKATTGFTGNAFGATNLNSVKFQSGSTYVQDAGSNPFGAGAPNSVLTFETGSLYKFTSPGGGPSYSGRTYANFENDSPLGGVQNNQGSNPMTCDNYTVTNGTINWDFTGGLVIKGNITVNSPGILTFGNATKSTLVTLNGTGTQTIGGTGTIQFGALGKLTAYSNLSFGPGTITFSNDASVITNGTVSGNVTYERAISGGAWHLISSPVSGAVSGMFLGSFLQQHSEPTNNYTDVTTSAVPLSPMKGFALFDATGYTAQFTGPLNTGAMSYTTTYSGAGLGWNLAGNPYPSAIDFTKVTRNNINNAFYVHISNSSWGVYAAGATSPDVVVTEFIAPGQGFFVEASANGSLSMDNTARVHNSIPFHKSGNVIPNIVRLQVTGNGYSDEALVRFLPEATSGFDGEYDAHKFYGDVAEAAQIYTVGGIPLAINALPETTTVPVGLHAGASGTYTIAANEINDFTEVSLEDTKTGVFTDLLKNSYTFNFALGETEQRFVLHFGPLSVDETESSLANIYSYLKTINVNLKDQVVGDVFVYSITGQLVASKISVSGSTGITIPNTGNYIVKVITRDSTLVRKVFIQ